MQTDPVRLFIEAWRTQTSRLPAPIYEEAAGFACCFADTPNLFYNLWVQSAPVRDEMDFDLLLAAAGARAEAHAHPVGGIISTESCPENWEILAARRGLVPLLPMISMEAEELRPPRRPPADLEIHRVCDDRGARDLAVLNARAYHMPEALFEGISTADFWPEDSCAFVAYEHGEPVSCAAALPVMDTVYIALVATDEQARGKGCAETVMRRAVEAGQELMGVTRTTLHASLAGHPLYEAMGYTSSTTLTLIGPEG